MSYNIHGLPWPIARGRPQALRRIGGRLAQMREQGQQPHIVLLQEAFSADAKSIAKAAEYPFVAAGPGRHDRSDMTADGAQKKFAFGNNKLKGESDGKLEDSGLLVLSDYPILDVERVPYARFACAGYDCLANKGLVMVRVRIPGASQPLTVIDTHMNSRGASGVSDRRADAAFGWQAKQLRSFVTDKVKASDPAIVAGDFNIGKTAYRQSMIIGGGGILPGSQDALRASLSANPSSADHLATSAIVNHGKDWMFARSGALTKLRLESVAVPFGHEPDGKALSDHFGYVAYYQIGDIGAHDV